MPNSTDLTYRVVKLPRKLRDAVRQQRDEQGMTNQKFVEQAVDTHLPVLLDSLRQLGFVHQRADSTAARLPFSDKAETLGKLRRAANELQLSSVRLLELCLIAATAGTASDRPRRRRRSSQKE